MIAAVRNNMINYFSSGDTMFGATLGMLSTGAVLSIATEWMVLQPNISRLTPAPIIAAGGTAASPRIQFLLRLAEMLRAARPIIDQRLAPWMRARMFWFEWHRLPSHDGLPIKNRHAAGCGFFVSCVLLRECRNLTAIMPSYAHPCMIKSAPSRIPFDSATCKSIHLSS